MDEKDKVIEALQKRLNIVVQQRNSFLDQLVLLQEQVEALKDLPVQAENVDSNA